MAAKTITKEQAEAQSDVLEQAAEESLPARGHARREEELRRQDRLQAEAERIAAQIQAGTVDPRQLDIVNDIANKTQYLSVSNPDPAFVYGWMSKNRHGQHVQAMRQLGWTTVQGDDPECIELKGTLGGTSPGTTRELGDVILMKIPRERYLVIKALEIAKQRNLQKASTSALYEMGEKYRNKGIIVRPFRMEDPDGDLSGPEMKPRRFTSKEKAMQMMSDHLKSGTVPGMEINQ